MLRKHLRYLRRWYRSHQDYDDPIWWFFTGLLLWLSGLWLVFFYR
ncbi:hypothetical protein [Goodfellowiella coeruleoviolacea]|nr:hypothetical protein [Goodfellowiella coeruleoviolacea]